MSKFLVDVVNFNADASCLSSERWISILQGGKNSKFYRWLNLYVKNNKAIVLGLPGATIADISTINPEAITLINKFPDIFQIILRPFAHDLALLRTSQGFLVNLICGINVIRNEFINIFDYYLPPEFMLTDEQVYQLSCQGILGTFVNPGRYSDGIQSNIPLSIYEISGVFGKKINCIPFADVLTKCYLSALQNYEFENWNNEIISKKSKYIFSWRDGESLFFLPDGISREELWLENESNLFERSQLNLINTNFEAASSNSNNYTYPLHSCHSWMREFRMLGYVNRISKAEDQIQAKGWGYIIKWLMTINSDILSSIEKESPKIMIKKESGAQSVIELTLLRTDRWFEGNEYLSILEEFLEGSNLRIYKSADTLPAYVKKYITRTSYLRKNENSIFVGIDKLMR
ncbi:hypothetical protein G6735_04715 [Polynucleobacter paneuropaeus]|nr:hypothetical protein [Polynucleobacter paneuropaeus]